jgi:predicted CXXCH cytochrome family protein
MALKPAVAAFAIVAAAIVVVRAQPPEPEVKAAPPGTYTTNTVQSCLRECHNKEPITFILQTPHAVKGDERTPFAQHQCETCHGPSPEHIAQTDTPVTIVFKGKLASPAADRNAKCLSCHQSGLRMHWSGSQHESRGVACNDCHTIHAPDQKVLRKATQAEVCFACHKEQRAQSRRIRWRSRASRAPRRWPARTAITRTARPARGCS